MNTSAQPGRLKSFLRLGLAVLSVAFVTMSSADATCVGSACNGERILTIYTNANGDVYVQVTGAMSALNCTLVSSTFITLKATAANFKQIYATLLASQFADRPLTFRIDDGSAGCTIAYVMT